MHKYSCRLPLIAAVAVAGATVVVVGYTKPRSPLEGPKEGIHQELVVERPGNHVVTYSFANRTAAVVPAPQVTTSCGCIKAIFDPTYVQPGQVAKLSLFANTATRRESRAADARLRWAGGGETKVSYRIVVARKSGVELSPSRIDVAALRVRDYISIAFVFDYYPAHAPMMPTVIVESGDTDITREVRIEEMRAIGANALSGVLRVPSAMLVESRNVKVSTPGIAEALLEVVHGSVAGKR